MPQLTDEEKEDLSPEELAAIEDDDSDPDGDDKGADDTADDAVDEVEKKPEDLPDAEEPKSPPVDEDKPKDEPAAEAPTTTIVPGLTVPTIPPEKIEKLEKAVEDAKAKFDDGEITYDDLAAAQRALDKATIKNETAAEINQASAQAGWQYEQKRFFEHNPVFAENEYLQSALISTVNKMIAAGEGKDFSDEAFLKEAQGRVIKGLEKAGFKMPSADPPPKTDADQKKDAAAALAAAKKKGADRGGIPMDLKNVPPADAPGADNEFAYLDNLDGEAYEKAVTKMGAAELERYENSH